MSVSCKVCGKSLVSKRGFRIKSLFRHGDSKKPTCDTCNKLYEIAELLENNSPLIPYEKNDDIGDFHNRLSTVKTTLIRLGGHLEILEMIVNHNENKNDRILFLCGTGNLIYYLGKDSQLSMVILFFELIYGDQPQS